MSEYVSSSAGYLHLLKGVGSIQVLIVCSLPSLTNKSTKSTGKPFVKIDMEKDAFILSALLHTASFSPFLRLLPPPPPPPSLTVQHRGILSSQGLRAE